MPIYEFKCAGCNHRFERFCQLGETGANISCPQCSKEGPKRVMSSFSSPGVKDDMNNFGGMNDVGSSCGSCGSNNCTTCH